MAMKFFDYQLATSLEEAPYVDATRRTPLVACFLNPHSFVTALHDGTFRKALRECDLLFPDGVGICDAVRHVRHVRIDKIAGDDFHRRLLQELDSTHGRIFYLGSRPEVLRRIRARLAAEHPSIAVATHAPTYARHLPAQESRDILREIDDFAPDALMVGMTAPKQEKWIHAHLPHLATPKVVAAIGGVFEFYAGTERRAPRWACDHHLEWLFRLAKSPLRMARRNLVSTPKFLWYVHTHKDLM